MNPSTTALILAAGKGTRMKSSKAKVLHEVFLMPMLHHVLSAVGSSGIDQCAVIVGHQRERVIESIQGFPVSPVIQEEQLGTGHAVLCAREACAKAEQVMILCGDTPLIRPETLQQMIDLHHQNSATVTLMTTLLDEPFGYGRILCDSQGQVIAIVEQKDATTEQLQIKEINAGIYLVDANFLFEALLQVGTDNSQGEVYLTDIVGIANRQGLKVLRFQHQHSIDVLGVNSRTELAQAHQELQLRRNLNLMAGGVTLYSPESTLVDPESTIGSDTIIHHGVRITGGCTIGEGCTIESGAVLSHCTIGDRAEIGANAVLHNSSIDEAEHVPPLTHRVG